MYFRGCKYKESEYACLTCKLQECSYALYDTIYERYRNDLSEEEKKDNNVIRLIKHKAAVETSWIQYHRSNPNGLTESEYKKQKENKYQIMRRFKQREKERKKQCIVPSADIKD